MEPIYDRVGPDGFRFPPYYRSPAECGKCYIYRGKGAHVWLGEQVDEFSAIVVDGDHLADADFDDDTNTVNVCEKALPRPFTAAQAVMWDRLDGLSQALHDLLAAS